MSLNEDMHTKVLGASEHCSCPKPGDKVCSTLGKWSYSPITDEEAEIPDIMYQAV